MKKIIATQSSQKTILKNIAEKINASLSIYNHWGEEEESKNRAIIDKNVVMVLPSEKLNMMSGAVMETIMETIEAYRKKYDNLLWGLHTTPVLKTDPKGKTFWTHAPMIVINFYNE